MTELPLTPAAEGILRGQLLDPANPAYWTAELCRIGGGVDVDRLVDAIAGTIVDAEVLHATIHDAHGNPRQRLTVDRAWRPEVRRIADEAEADAVIETLRGTAADLERGPLFHCVLFVTPEAVLWYLQAHHVVLDGFGYALLYRQVERRYRGRLAPGDSFGRLHDLVEHEASYDEEARARDRRFWMDRLSGVAASGFAGSTATGVDRPIALRVETAALEAVGHRWPHVLLAAVAGALHRRTGVPLPVLGLPVAGRLGTPAATIPAMVMNINPLPVPVAPGATLSDVTTTIATAMSAARKHQRYRYEQLRRDLGLLSGGRRLFGPVVNVIPFAEPPRFDGHTVTMRHVSAGPVDDLSITARGPRDLVIEANPQLYTVDDLRSIGEDLRDILDHPERPVGTWRVIDGPVAEPTRPFTERFAANVIGTPDHPALADGDRTWSYVELDTAARAVATWLRRQGVRPGELVGIALPRGADAVIAILGAHLAGAGYLPIDPDGAPERNAAILAEAAPRLVLAEPPTSDRPTTDDGNLSAAVEADESESDGPAYVIYTSGSTGRPKGVIVPRSALDFFVGTALRRYEVTADDRVLQFAPLHFDAHVEEVFVTLAAGATLVVRDDSATRSIEEFVHFVGRSGVTVLDLPTAYWHELVWALRHKRTEIGSSVRLVIIGGEAASTERTADWHATTSGITLVNSYGPTEATVVCLAATLAPGEPVTLGEPLPGVTAAVGPGDELYIAGAGLATGYLGVHDDDPFVTIAGRRYYRTGDRVRFDGGALRFHGRIDTEVKISGHRVHPAEVEAALLADPRVRHAAVVVDHHRGAPRLFAHVEADATGEELRGAARSRLAGPALPTAIHVTDALPRTSTGKIDRAALTHVVQDSSPTPSTPMEATVLEVFTEVNGTAPTTMDTDFFASGGTSLSAVAAASRLGALLGRTVTAAELFDHPTVATLAAALTGDGDGSTDASLMLTDADWTPPVLGARRTEPVTVLTGATGFVGAHVLAELLERTDDRIACLTRGGMERLASVASEYGLPELDAARVAAVDCDLTAEDLALSEPSILRTARRFVHCAADVNLSRGYRSLRRVNVDATRTLLAAACANGAEFHHVSTIAVGAGTVLPEDFIDAHDGLADGYQRSKWVAEELVRHAGSTGLTVSCHRLGRVIPARATGARSSNDLVWRIGRVGVDTGVFPDLPVSEPWISVDVAAAAIAGLVVDGGTGVWNHLPSAGVPLTRLWERLTPSVPNARVVPLPKWLDLLRAQVDTLDGAAGLLSFFESAGPPPPDGSAIAADRFTRWLKESSIALPSSPLDDFARALLSD